MVAEYHQAIQHALRSGYAVDADAGVIYGLNGVPLSIALRGTQRYPTITLSVHGMRKRRYAVPAHKVVAYAIWGNLAFADGTHVRHMNGPSDIRKVSLRLGTASQNEKDKRPEVRNRVARAARKAQPVRPYNTKVSDETVKTIRLECAVSVSGRAVRGEVKRLAERFGVSRTTISNYIRGYYGQSVT